MNTFSDAVEVLVRHYITAKARANFAIDRGDVDLSISYSAQRSALYDVLLELADYDEEIVIDWITA